MKVEKVSFSYKGLKVKDKLGASHPFLYTSDFTAQKANKSKFSIITGLLASCAVIITLINIKKRI